MKNIAIQGVRGAFHQEAAYHYYTEPIDIVECMTFDEVFAVVEKGVADEAIMAIENTIGGSILPNYKLLRNSGLKICGEIFLCIEQNLLGLRGTTIDEIEEVYSHPMAILQTQDFFKKYPQIKLINSVDTALSAKDIAVGKMKKMGAVASRLAADIYGLEILASSIQSVRQNQTRFLILKPRHQECNEQKIDKSSISFVLQHKKGSLSQILSVFAFYDMNLTKIQSIPILGREWEYEFFVDLTFEDVDNYRRALEAVRPLLIELTILGEYSRGKVV